MSVSDQPPTAPGGTPALSSPQSLEKLAIPSEEPSSDSNLDDDPLFADPDDAQSLVQPALSPAATRLTSPKTPAAEKAAAMEKLPGGGLFSVFEGSVTPDVGTSAAPPRKLTKPAPNRQNRGLSLGQLPPNYVPLPKLPSPWHPGPKELIVQNEPPSRPALSAVFGGTRQRRSSSGGAEAFRRLKEALPNITLPTNFFSNLKSPSFFSDSSSQKSPNLDAKQMSLDGNAESRQVPGDSLRGSDGHAVGNSSLQPPSAGRTRPRTIRKSTSDESMLYHSLSRMSSLGDDDRWGDVSEQANVRFKAIKESFDRPTFKMPQLPQSLYMKKHSLLSSESVDEKRSATPPMVSHQPGAPQKDGQFSELNQALEMLTGDIVIMGGYRGSILRSTRTNRQVWVPVKVGLNIRKVNLEVGLEPEDERRMEETIYPSGMLTNIGPVDISRRLFKRLRECENARNGKLRVWDYGWDWRLSPHLLSQRLIAFLEQLPSNQTGDREQRGATVIAHSLGGLITRHAVNQRPDLFAGVVFAGTPQRCINILGPIRNGDAVLLNEKVLTAQVNFSLRTSFAFLPEDGFCFVNKNTGEQFPIDFYDAEEWAKYSLSPCVGPILPAYNARPSALGSLLNLSSSLPSLPMRNRGNSSAGELGARSSTRNVAAEAVRRAEVENDHTLAPQMGGASGHTAAVQQQEARPKNVSERDRYMQYLKRTLADTKRFRAELHHQPELTELNLYPPMATMYGKEIPTVYGAHVTNRDAIPCADAYDDLLFHSGDGVVLAREAMLPPGYDVVNGGRISTDRGHITMLGDLPAVGRALQAIVRGRQKGIGMGRAA
ncbi:putative AB hydrolase-1 domain-containing protein [Seiridium unicorne]|uniref:AB hydrolase-1 domain-containing protein n=1 Tax=Seiridium unicorne TaxID=138068 RepID=A0ABR2UR03_9PEZI